MDVCECVSFPCPECVRVGVPSTMWPLTATVPPAPPQPAATIATPALPTVPPSSSSSTSQETQPQRQSDKGKPPQQQRQKKVILPESERREVVEKTKVPEEEQPPPPPPPPVDSAPSQWPSFKGVWDSSSRWVCTGVCYMGQSRLHRNSSE